LSFHRFKRPGNYFSKGIQTKVLYTFLVFRKHPIWCLTHYGSHDLRILTVPCILYQSLLDYDMIYLLAVIGLTPGVNSTVHIYTQTIHRTTQ